jgi:DNA-binding CsgD family transcriptional regulator
LPKSLVEVIVQRLDFLPRKARETLEMAAVLGKSIDVAETSTVLELSVAEVSDVVSQALDAGLLVDTGRQLVFRHDLIRQVLAEHLPLPVRTALHLRAGQKLASLGAPVERVAAHLLAGTTLDRQTLEWLVRSADSLIVRAPKLAVSLLRRALAAVEDDTADVLRFHLVRALLWDGHPADAEPGARAALAADRDPDREGRLRWLLAQACYRQGRLADTVAVAEEALSSAHLTPGEIGRFQGFSAICLFYLERFDAGEVAAAKAVAAGEAGRDPHASAIGYLAMAALRFAQGDMEQALSLNDRALAAFDRGIQPDLQVDPYAMRGYCLLELDRFADADEALATAVGHNLRTGGVYLTLVYALRARLRFLDGRWDDALAEIQTGLDSPDPLGQAPGLRALAALIAIHRGTYFRDPDGIPEPDDGLGGRKYGYLMRWAQALVQETQTGQQHALDLLYPVWEQARGLDNRRVIYRICPDLARLAAGVGDRKRAQDLATTAEALAAPQPTDSLRGTAQLCRGLADEEPDLLLAAAQSFRQARWPLYEGHAYESLAVVVARLGRTDEARDALDKALGLYAGLDAAWAMARAEARLRQAGIRRGVHGRRKRPRHGWEALTETERKVALLVAEGRSNLDIATHMFLSRRTVQSHVSSILTKLNLRSRVELAIRASRRSPSPPI